MSCEATKTGTVLPPTGIPQTSEWIAYNDQAETNNAPKLVYLVTCEKLAKSKPRKPLKITDHFSLTDKKAYIYTRWTNVFGPHVFKLKNYDPRGVLFGEWETSYTYAGPNWNVWASKRIKDAPSSRLPGEWTTEIYMDGILAARKKTVIGHTNVRYKKISLGKEVPAVGVIRFVPKGEKGKRFDYELPNFIARMMTIDYPNYRVIMPWEIRKEIEIPNDVKLENYINSLMNTHLFSDFVTDHNINLLIAGSAYDGGQYGERKRFEVYIIDVKSRVIAKHFKTTWTSKKARHGVDGIIIYSCNKVYRVMMEEAKYDIERILAKK